jgi:hypothetical protein
MSNTVRIALRVIVLFTIIRSGSAQDLVKPFHVIAHSTVLIVTQKDANLSVGVGVIIDSSATGSVILTAAHVLEPPQVEALHLPSVSNVTVYQGFNSEPISTAVSVPASDLDHTLDLALVRISKPNLPVSCLAAGSFPAGDRIGIAAYSMRSLAKNTLTISDLPNLMKRAYTYQTVREGVIGQITPDDIEYFAPEELGFSGGPIFDEQSSLVMAVVQKAFQVGYKQSIATYESTANRPFKDFVSSRMSHMEFVDNSIRRYGSAGQPRFPDMARNGRMVMLQTTSDGGRNDRGMLTSYAEMVAQGIREMFGLADLIRRDDRQLQTDLIGVEEEADRTRIRFNFFQQLCDLHQAAGVVGLKRVVDQDLSVVRYQVSYIDCAGDVYETVNIEPFPASPSSDGRLRDMEFAKMRKDISEGLGRTPVTARGNFKIFGTYIGDGEHRSFSTIRRSEIKPDVLIINVAPGARQPFLGSGMEKRSLLSTNMTWPSLGLIQMIS